MACPGFVLSKKWRTTTNFAVPMVSTRLILHFSIIFQFFCDSLIRSDDLIQMYNHLLEAVVALWWNHSDLHVWTFGYLQRCRDVSRKSTSNFHITRADDNRTRYDVINRLPKIYPRRYSVWHHDSSYCVVLLMRKWMSMWFWGRSGFQRVAEEL